MNKELQQAVSQINLRHSAKKFLGLLTNVSLSLEDFAFRLQDLVKESNTSIDINNVLEAEAVLIGGLLDSDMYPEVGEKWENEFLRVIDEVAPSFTAIQVKALIETNKIEPNIFFQHSKLNQIFS